MEKNGQIYCMCYTLGPSLLSEQNECSEFRTVELDTVYCILYAEPFSFFSLSLSFFLSFFPPPIELSSLEYVSVP